ncbi:hypothetical protein NQ317_011464, partial [Molorchus minor]
SKGKDEHLSGKVLEATQSAVSQLKNRTKLPRTNSKGGAVRRNFKKYHNRIFHVKKYSECQKNVNIRKFSKLIPHLKSKSVGYRPNKSRILTKEEIERFLQEASDN